MANQKAPLEALNIQLGDDIAKGQNKTINIM
jgi:hypothetical protein